MAKARVSQKINPLDLQKNVAVGIPFPLGGTPIFASTYTTQDQALSNLKNLLLTRKGERPLQPLFGTDIPSFLFENITQELLDNLKDKDCNPNVIVAPEYKLLKYSIISDGLTYY